MDDLHDDEILSTLRRNVLVVLPDLTPELVTPERRLADLGANSIDRADIVTLTMEALDVRVPVTEFAEVRDIAALLALLRKHAG